MRIALLHARLRVEERLLLDAFERAGVTCEPLEVRDLVFDSSNTDEWRRFDVVFDRSLSLTSSLATVRLFESIGVRCVNRSSAIEVCSDKLRTSLALVGAGIPTPRFCATPSGDSALEAIERIGYPCVLKPTVGSWGRLVSRVNDRDAAEALVEHRTVLGSTQHAVTYVQEFIETGCTDIRAFVVGGSTICAIERTSDHWITNTARGGKARAIEVDAEMDDLCRRASACVGGDIVAVDLFRTPGGLLVNEVNHSMEFRNSIEPTGVDIPGLMVECVLREGVPA